MSFDPTLVNTVLSARAITKLAPKFAYLQSFSTDFSDELKDERSRTLNVPYISAASAAVENPTNFEDGTNTTLNRPVNMIHVNKTSSIGPADYGTGSRLESFADMSLSVIATKIEAMVFANITEANFGAPTVSGLTAGAMTSAHLRSLYAALPGDDKVCIIRNTEFAAFLPSDLNSFDITKQKSAFGYDYIDRTDNGFSSAGTKLVAFAANKGALVMASAIPQYTDAVNDLLERSIVEIPGTGLFIESAIWASSASRRTFHSFGLLFGATVGDVSALKLAKLV